MSAQRLPGGRTAIHKVPGRSHGVSRVPFLMSLLHLLLFPSGSALEITDQAPQIKCSEGLTYCELKDNIFIPAKDSRVNVSNVELNARVCCVNKTQDCELCLQIILTIQVVVVLVDKNEFAEESGDHSDEDEISINTQMIQGSGKSLSRSSEAQLNVVLSTPGFNDKHKEVHFTRSQPILESENKIWLTEKVQSGSLVRVIVQEYAKDITIPSLENVCPLHQNVKGCETPGLRVVTEHVREKVVLQINDTNGNKRQVMCQMIWNDMPGQLLNWSNGQTELSIPLNAVAPCLCFQVWWDGKPLRKVFCPFRNQTDILERMKNNLSLSLSEGQTTNGGTALSWTVTAPCRLDGEVWLCKQNSGAGVCEEVAGYRQTLQNNDHAGWSYNQLNQIHMRKGEFLNKSPHSALCIQIKVAGMVSVLEPHCPFTTPRFRWVLTLVITLLLICLAILGTYGLRVLLKAYMWRWINKGDVKGATGGAHVVLLYPPDGDRALPMLMCRLGSSLHALGFSVSLDLWSRAELSALGPVPWLHSRLDRLQREGGKVVLVLTETSWARADEWGSQGWERDTCRRRNREVEEAEGEKGAQSSPTHSDAFGASLSCILADYLQGRAGERFVLVQFEALPPQPPGSSRPLPELFRGLHLYSLPSHSLAFLTELALGRHGNASARRKRAGRLRVASRALARGLTGLSAGSTALRLAGLSQDCVGVEDPWESVPLQPSQTTPASSPDTTPRVSGMEWV